MGSDYMAETATDAIYRALRSPEPDPPIWFMPPGEPLAESGLTETTLNSKLVSPKR